MYLFLTRTAWRLLIGQLVGAVDANKKTHTDAQNQRNTRQHARAPGGGAAARGRGEGYLLSR